MPRFLADPRDTAAPDGAIVLLQRLFHGDLLSPTSTARIIAMMEATETGAARIKGLLPAGAIVAHKTGTTGVVRGLNGSTNDIGVITLPGGGGRIALAVFLKGSTRNLRARELTIARVAQAVCL